MYFVICTCINKGIERHRLTPGAAPIGVLTSGIIAIFSDLFFVGACLLEVKSVGCCFRQSVDSTDTEGVAFRTQFGFLIV